jgi:hypothetical protein
LRGESEASHHLPENKQEAKNFKRLEASCASSPHNFGSNRFSEHRRKNCHQTVTSSKKKKACYLLNSKLSIDYAV